MLCLTFFSLTVENRRLSQQVSEVHVGKMQKGYNLRPLEEVQLLRAQVRVHSFHEPCVESQVRFQIFCSFFVFVYINDVPVKY